MTSFQDAEARNFGRENDIDRTSRYQRAEELLQVTGKLWDSWDDDALVLDRQAPLFADPTRVHRVDHHGEWFDVQGPLNVPRRPQGYPVLIQAGLSTLSYHLDIDLAPFPHDERLPDVEVPGVEGHYHEVRELTEKHGLTLREVGKGYGGTARSC